MMKKKRKSQKPSKADLEFIDQLINKSVKASHDRQMKERVTDMAIIGNNITEYLDSFILLGYDLNGNSVKIVHAPTPKDTNGLSTLLSELIIDENNRNDSL